MPQRALRLSGSWHSGSSSLQSSILSVINETSFSRVEAAPKGPGKRSIAARAGSKALGGMAKPASLCL